MSLTFCARIMILLTFLLSGCATQDRYPTQMAANLINRQQVVATTTEYYPAKKPQTVSLYTHEETPHTAYRIIGLASVSKFNLFGMKREEVTLNDMMKNLAASIGGDGLINLYSNDLKMEANVIAFQKILI
jgi:hypothetical protein